MSLQKNGIIKTIIEAIVNHGVDWIITMVVTFISVRFATKKYYNSVKARNVRPHMEQGLKLNIGEENYSCERKVNSR